LEQDRTKLAVDLFDKNAALYQSKYMDVSKYQASLDLFCSGLSTSNAEVLELACGPGNITKYLLSQMPELSILATDLSPAMLELAESNNPGATFEILDCRSVLELNRKFDGVICGFGLPYLSREEAIKMIQDISNSLKDNGLVYLSTMEGDYAKSGYKSSSSNPDDRLFMYFHEEDYLINALQKSGIAVVETSRVTYVDNNDEPVIDLILIGKKDQMK